MKIRRISSLTGIENVMELNVEAAGLMKWKRGGKVQHVFPHLNADEREFLISGCLPGEFEKIVGPEEPEEQECISCYGSGYIEGFECGNCEGGGFVIW